MNKSGFNVVRGENFVGISFNDMSPKYAVERSLAAIRFANWAKLFGLTIVAKTYSVMAYK